MKVRKNNFGAIGVIKALYRAPVKQTLFLGKAAPNFNIRTERTVRKSPPGINYVLFNISSAGEADFEYSQLEDT